MSLFLVPRHQTPSICKFTSSCGNCGPCRAPPSLQVHLGVLVGTRTHEGISLSLSWGHCPCCSPPLPSPTEPFRVGRRACPPVTGPREPPPRLGLTVEAACLIRRETGDQALSPVPQPGHTRASPRTGFLFQEPPCQPRTGLSVWSAQLIPWLYKSVALMWKEGLGAPSPPHLLHLSASLYIGGGQPCVGRELPPDLEDKPMWVPPRAWLGIICKRDRSSAGCPLPPPPRRAGRA